jgi:hypothetical protein
MRLNPKHEALQHTLLLTGQGRMLMNQSDFVTD